MSAGIVTLRRYMSFGAIMMQYVASANALSARFDRMRRFLSLGTMMIRDAPARPGMGTVMASIFVSLVVAAMTTPAALHAQNILDPSAQVQGVASGWISSAKSIAQGIWGSLIVIEFVFFGIQFGLFRDNFTEMFGSMALKVITTGFFLWLIQNADTLLPAVIHSFTKAATDMDPNAGGSGLVSLSAQVLASIALIFAGAAVALGLQQGLALISAPFVLGNGFAGQADSVDVANNINILLMQLIAFLMVGCVAVIVLQWALTNIESYIVMFAGIIFLGFTGSRWTLPFAQGYMSYALNVGTKLFTLYLILSIESSLATNVLLPVAAAAIAIGADPTGVGGPPALLLLMVAAVNVMIMAALAWYIPNIAGSFLSGQSSLSASSMMTMMTSAASGIAASNAQRSQAHLSDKAASKMEHQQAHLSGMGSGASGSANGSMPGAATTTALGQPGGGEASGAPANAQPVNGQSNTAGGGIWNANAGGGGGNGTANGAGGGTAGVQTGQSQTGTSNSVYSSHGSPSSGPIGTAVGASNGGGGGGSVGGVPALDTGGTGGGSGGESYSADSTSGAPPPMPPPVASPLGASGGSAMQRQAMQSAAAQARSQASASQLPAGTPEIRNMTPEQRAGLSAADGRAHVGHDDFSQISAKEFGELPPATQQAIKDELKSQGEANRVSEQMSEAYALSAMASALPHGESAPSAVQVRMNYTDKL